MANGSDVIDEGFFRRYRELLDAEDAAFDKLEHASKTATVPTGTPTSPPGGRSPRSRCAFLGKQGLAPVATA